MEVGRRGFIGGLLALIAAPAIVRPESLMMLAPTEKLILPSSNSLLTIDMITREAASLFRDSNAFLRAIDRQYEDKFAADGAKIGSVLRIRLPLDYTVTDGPLVPNMMATIPKISAPEAAAIGAAAVLAKNPTISRRFWDA